MAGVRGETWARNPIKAPNARGEFREWAQGALPTVPGAVRLAWRRASFGLLTVDADDFEASLRELDGEGQAHVPETDDAEAGRAILKLLL